jgi:hypothetical protein
MEYVLVFRPEVRDELSEAYNWYESHPSRFDPNFCGDRTNDT